MKNLNNIVAWTVRQEWFCISLVLIVSIPLLWSGVVHFSGPFFFMESLLSYELIPERIAGIVAACLVHISLVVSLAMLSRRFTPEVCLFCSGLYFLFSIAQGYALLRGTDISCGCFGPSATKISIFSLMIPLSLCVLSTLLFFVQRNNEKRQKNNSNIRD